MSAKTYTEGRDFSAQELWNWTWRLRKEGKLAAIVASPKSLVPRVRLARVVSAPSQARAAEHVGVPLFVEVAGVRIAVPMGFDRATFSAVLDEVEARRARGGRP